MFGFHCGRHDIKIALVVAGLLTIPAYSIGWGQAWEQDREEGVGGAAPAPAMQALSELAEDTNRDATNRVVIRVAEGEPVDPFPASDSTTGPSVPAHQTTAQASPVSKQSTTLVPYTAAPNTADNNVRPRPTTAADLLGNRSAQPAKRENVAALPKVGQPTAAEIARLLDAPVRSDSSSEVRALTPAERVRAGIEQAQFAPNAVATPKAVIPPRGDEQRAAPAPQVGAIFLPSPRKPALPVAPAAPAASVDLVQFAPNVAKAPKEAVLRAGPTPDNKLVELVETPSDQALALSAGRGQLLNLDKPVSDVFVADPNIADVRVVSANKLFVHGNQLGRTNIFGMGPRGDVVFAIDLDVVPDAEAAQADLAELAPDSDTSIDLVSGKLVAEGTVSDVGEAIQVATLSEQLAATEGPTANNTVINKSQQINIRVRFAEVTRNDVFNLGINWEALVDTDNFLFGLASGSGPVAPTEAFGSIFGEAQFGSVNVEAFIDALQREGIINLLAEPNLTAVNGEVANFLAGGEIPIPVPGGAGRESVTIDYKPFGVSLDFIPTLLPGDRINLRVRPEVSSINSTGGVVIDGFSIPAFTVRRAETSVELASGQTFAIAGLFQRDLTTDTDEFPVLGDVPILGQLFRSQRFQRYETELVILITPYLVQPTTNRNIALPNDRTDIPTKPLAKKKSGRRAGFIVN